MLEKCRLCIDKKHFAGGVLMELNKTFDTKDYQCLLEKLHTYESRIKIEL